MPGGTAADRADFDRAEDDHAAYCGIDEVWCDMPAPLGYSHRHESGLRGALARWWLARRTACVRRALDRLRDVDAARTVLVVRYQGYTPEPTGGPLADFARYCQERGIREGEEAAAFAAWLSGRPGWAGYDALDADLYSDEHGS